MPRLTLILDANVLRGASPEFLKRLDDLRVSGRVATAITQGILEELITPEEGTSLAKANLEKIRKHVDRIYVEPSIAINRLISLTDRKRRSKKNKVNLFVSRREQKALLNGVSEFLSAERGEEIEKARATRKDAGSKLIDKHRELVAKVMTELKSLGTKEEIKKFMSTLDNSAIVKSCLNITRRQKVKNPWWGFPITNFLPHYGVDLGAKSISDPHRGSRLFEVMRNYRKLPGLRLFHAHIARLIFSQYGLGKVDSKLDDSVISDAQHLLYLNERTRLVTKDKELLETGAPVNLEDGQLVIPPEEIEGALVGFLIGRSKIK